MGLYPARSLFSPSSEVKKKTGAKVFPSSKMNPIFIATSMSSCTRRTLSLVSPRATSSIANSPSMRWRLPAFSTVRHFSSGSSLSSEDKTGDKVEKAWTKAGVKRRFNDNVNNSNDAIKGFLNQDLGPPIEPIMERHIQIKGRHVVIGVPFIAILLFGRFLGFWIRLSLLVTIVAGAFL